MILNNTFEGQYWKWERLSMVSNPFFLVFFILGSMIWNFRFWSQRSAKNIYKLESFKLLGHYFKLISIWWRCPVNLFFWTMHQWKTSLWKQRDSWAASINIYLYSFLLHHVQFCLWHASNIYIFFNQSFELRHRIWRSLMGTSQKLEPKPWSS